MILRSLLAPPGGPVLSRSYLRAALARGPESADPPPTAPDRRPLARAYDAEQSAAPEREVEVDVTPSSRPTALVAWGVGWES